MESYKKLNDTKCIIGRYFLFLISIISIRCNMDNREIEKKYEAHKMNYEKVWNLEVPFPEKLSLFKAPDRSNGNKNKLLAFISTDCAECVSKMEAWKNFLGEQKIDNTEYAFVALGKPTAYFSEYIKSNQLPFAIYIDTTGGYLYRNNISGYYQTALLLNASRKVVMVGDPEKDPNILELYQYAASEK